MKDGIYRINRSPLVRYLVVKHYGDAEKTRYMTSLEDCKQQIQEWDAEYKVCTVKKMATRKNSGYAREYHVYDKDNVQIACGKGKDVASLFGCHINTLINAANRMVNFQNNLHVIAY